MRGQPFVHEFVWILNFVSFFFLYPSTFNLLEVCPQSFQWIVNLACYAIVLADLLLFCTNRVSWRLSLLCTFSAPLSFQVLLRWGNCMLCVVANSVIVLLAHRSQLLMSPSCICGRQASCASPATPRILARRCGASPTPCG